jgi:nitrogen fixation/metabolism regulation signal transduction histidine kinase
MTYNKFYISIFLRIIIIVLTCFLFVYFIEKEDSLLTTVFVVFLVLVQIAYLIKYVNRTNRDLAEFLVHLQQGDTSVVFSKENIEKTFIGLSASFDKINTDLGSIRSEKVQQEQYLNFIIDNLKTGLVAFDESGNIEFINNQAKIFLNIISNRSRNISELEPECRNVFKETSISESKIIKKIINDDLYYLAFSPSKFKIKNKILTIFSIYDVKQEIESNEIESWQKLTSVLTHEMMNSLTPITSLSHAIKRYLIEDDKLINSQDINQELLTDVVENANIIENRSKGLLEFINNYRTITNLPKPKFETILLQDLLNKSILLFDKEISDKEIDVELNVASDLSLLADKGMIEQVVINLIKNSIEAFDKINKPKITFNAFMDTKGRVKVAISDNGSGIDKEKMDNIFIPFFTTKENGTGVGLSLSRQIMRLHKGSINLYSEPGVQTKVNLTF